MEQRATLHSLLTTILLFLPQLFKSHLSQKAVLSLFLPKALQIPCATAENTWATSKAAGTGGQVFWNRWHPFHHRLLWQALTIRPEPLLSRLRSRAAGPGQQSGAPFFSQSPTTPGSALCCCQKGEGLPCVKGREEGKRRCQRVCVCVC